MARARSLADTFAPFRAGSAATVDHGVWQRLLGTYVKPDAAGLNRIDHAAWKAVDHGRLKDYVKALQAVDVATLDRPEQFAFWANLYNAVTMDVVLDKFPVASIKEINLGGGVKSFITGGPWQARIVTVGRQSLSLDAIENDIMRPIFKDPRVHYALNCASIGCPNLPTAAFTGQTLETMLEANARAFVNSPRGIRSSPDGVVASSIYDWYRADFGGTVDGVLAHVKSYAAPALKAVLTGRNTIDRYEYDWALAGIAATR